MNDLIRDSVGLTSQENGRSNTHAKQIGDVGNHADREEIEQRFTRSSWLSVLVGICSLRRCALTFCMYLLLRKRYVAIWMYAYISRSFDVMHVSSLILNRNLFHYSTFPCEPGVSILHGYNCSRTLTRTVHQFMCTTI